MSRFCARACARSRFGPNFRNNETLFRNNETPENGHFWVILGPKKLFGPPRDPAEWAADTGTGRGRLWGVLGHTWGAFIRFGGYLWSSGGPGKCLADTRKWPFLGDFGVKIAVGAPRDPAEWEADTGTGSARWTPENGNCTGDFGLK